MCGLAACFTCVLQLWRLRKLRPVGEPGWHPLRRRRHAHKARRLAPLAPRVLCKARLGGSLKPFTESLGNRRLLQSVQTPLRLSTLDVVPTSEISSKSDESTFSRRSSTFIRHFEHTTTVPAVSTTQGGLVPEHQQALEVRLTVDPTSNAESFHVAPNEVELGRI